MAPQNTALPKGDQRTTDKPTYAQIVASPPRTPTPPSPAREHAAKEVHTGTEEDEHENTLTSARTPPPQPLPGHTMRYSQYSPIDGEPNQGDETSITSDERRRRLGEEEDEIRQYDHPTLEDWKNLSIHGNDSMSSEMVKDCLGETLAHFGGDIEQHVTDGIDRHGNHLPEYERLQEEERSRKRQRTDSTEHKEPKKISIRFRKYRPLPLNATSTPVNPLEKVKGWMNVTGSPPSPSPDPKPKTQKTPQWYQYPLATSTTGGESETNSRSMHAAPRDPPLTAPSMLPHPRAGGYDTRPLPSPLELEPMDIDVPNERSPQAGGDKGHWPPTTATVDTPRNHERPGATGLRNVEVLPSTSHYDESLISATRRATPTPGTHHTDRSHNALILARTPLVLPAVAEEEEYSLTPTPEDGFPVVHHARPESLTEDLAQRRVNDLWKHDQDRVVLLHVANVGYPSPGQRTLMSVEITGLIRAFTGETDFVVVAPEPEWVEPPARRKAPRTWAVLGLSRTAASRVIMKHVLSSTWVTILAYERKLMIPRYLFTLAGFTNNYNDNIRTAILEAFASDPIYSSISRLVQSHPVLASLDPDDAVAEVLSTLMCPERNG
ncbi:hypothetical protein C2E23DRAFT_880467 [Lenzites betulinus]|nr:hypothetical protein C2E23DRAFT_880467 [Lenzites betulinus]